MLNINIQHTKTIGKGNNNNPFVGAKRRVHYESQNKPLGKRNPSVPQSLLHNGSNNYPTGCDKDIDNILPRERSDAVMKRRNI